MRTLALLALLLLAPLASAQQTATLVLELDTPTEALARGSTTDIPGRVTLTSDPTVALQPSGVPVAHTVAAAPEWATVTISPHTDVFTFHPQPALAWTSQRVFIVRVHVPEDAPAGAFVVEVRSTTHPGTGGNSVTAASHMQLLVREHAPLVVARADEVASEDPAARVPGLAVLGTLAAVGTIAAARRSVR